MKLIFKHGLYYIHSLAGGPAKLLISEWINICPSITFKSFLKGYASMKAMICIIHDVWLCTYNSCLLPDDKDPNICGVARHWLESVSVSIDMNGKGFHRYVSTSWWLVQQMTHWYILYSIKQYLALGVFREMVTTVKFSPDVPHVLNVLLVHKLPRGIYVDPYQLASLTGDSHLEVTSFIIF